MSHTNARRPRRYASLLLAFSLAFISTSASAATPVGSGHVNQIKGKVVDQNGNPVAGVQVGAASRSLGYINYSGNGRLYVYGQSKRILLLFKAQNGGSSAESTTDASGRFILTNIMDGPVNLAAAHPQHGVAFINNIDPVNDGNEVLLTLTEPNFATGRVRGIPDQNHSILMGEAARQYSFARFTPVEPQKANDISYNISTAIGPDGNFRIGPLPEGIDDWVLAFDRRARNYSATVLEIPVTVSKLSEHPVDVDLTEGHKLAGIIRGPKNEFLPDVSISTMRSDGIRVGTVTDHLGKFEIAGLQDGNFELKAERWARRTAPG